MECHTDSLTLTLTLNTASHSSEGIKPGRPVAEADGLAKSRHPWHELGEFLLLRSDLPLLPSVVFSAFFLLLASSPRGPDLRYV